MSALADAIASIATDRPLTMRAGTSTADGRVVVGGATVAPSRWLNRPAVAGQPVVLLLQGGVAVAVGDTATGWVSAGALAAGWAPETTHPVRYRRLSSGLVVLEGIVVKPGATTVDERIFTLPAGFRPGTKQHFGTSMNWGYGGIGVTPAGVVGCGTTHASVPWLSLSCSWYAEQ